MDLQLRGKTAFISGSTGGIGAAIARTLAAEGARVIVNGRSEQAVQDAVAALRRTHPDADHDGIVADFADPASVERLLGDLGDVDILVNNVGQFGLAEFASISDDEWSHVLEVNLMSGVRLSRHALPGMLDRGWGRILFVSSESGVNIPADMIHYGVTKAAMIALGNGLAKLTRGTTVTVNTILGGPTYSDGVATTIESTAAAQSAPVEAVQASIIGQNRTTLLERFIEPEEIASLAAYLASPLASATNGAALRADGGVLTGML
jgi:NAD(P)-dependent dehydrogenase (short-subunit alcohol dehydrogenase family)